MRQDIIKHKNKIKIPILSVVLLCLIFTASLLTAAEEIDYYKPVLIPYDEAVKIASAASSDEYILDINESVAYSEEANTVESELTKEEKKDTKTKTSDSDVSSEKEKNEEFELMPYEPEEGEEAVPQAVLPESEEDPDVMSVEEAASLGLILNQGPFVPDSAPEAVGNGSDTSEISVASGAQELTEEEKQQVMAYADDFWAEDSDFDVTRKKDNQHVLNISGIKTFELKQADVRGDVGHFSSEQYESYPGFKMDQSLHLEIDGHINENSTVNAVLDDKDDEDRRFTVNINTPKWNFVLGDFNLELDNTEFSLFSKEVRGIIAQGNFNKHYKAAFLFAQSKGAARREQFRGAGSQQEYRLQAFPIVQDSEKVKIDGVLLVRNSDYMIDYEEGIIKFSPDILPIEITRWITVEYETSDENMAYSRNIFGTRHEYFKDENRHVGVTWLREIDGKSPKSATDVETETASGTAGVASESESIQMPMQHDVLSADFSWKLGKYISLEGETAVSNVDPNIKSDLTAEDRAFKGHAHRFGINAETDKLEFSTNYYNIDNKFRLIGREDGVIELGERGLVNDVVSSRSKFKYTFSDKIFMFGDGEDSETNKDNDPNENKIDFEQYNSGFVWTPGSASRFEVRAGSQRDHERDIDALSDLRKDTASVVFDRIFGKTNAQIKYENTEYDDRVNIASGTAIKEINFNMNSKVSDDLSWNMVLSKIEMEDNLVKSGPRSETKNYTFDVSYEPSDIFRIRSQMQWRREDDLFANSRSDSSLVDSQIDYEPNDNLKSQFKYKVENTSKIVRDDTLDKDGYMIPGSLPTDVQEELQVLSRFETPVQKATTNFNTDYRINDKMQAYVDWKRRDIEDRSNGKLISRSDRKNYELRIMPLERMLITAEYERGLSRDNNNVSEVKDFTKMLQLRHEFRKDYTLELTYELSEDDDLYDDLNDERKKSSIASFQRIFNPKVMLEFGLQYDDIDDKDPSKEFEKNLALTLTPSSRNQRYKFFIKHRDVESTMNGVYYEGGLSLSQFIGADTIIDGEIKQVHSDSLPSGEAYDATVINAKVMITF